MKKDYDKKPYSIVGCFDTETTNIGKGNETRAICILYIMNDLRQIDLNNYQIERDDNISLFRTENKALKWIEMMVDYGKENTLIPIIAAYNLSFDLQTLIYSLNEKYIIKCCAQSSTNFYTVDLFEEENEKEPVLRFWDCFHLEMRGLSAMGETAGLEKAKGDWDYSLIRTSKTKLTKKEIYYARRDVQVIPAYLKYLLNANEWLKQNDFGNKVLTKTSLVRQMAINEIGNIRINKKNGKTISLLWAFQNMCRRQQAKTFQQYALRKSCFRGGFTFTSGNYASKIVENVTSLDVVSMHHAFINGRFIPVDFEECDTNILSIYCDKVINTNLKDVLECYHKPFDVAFHVRIKFDNLRLKENSAFDKWKIALIPMGKFRKIVADSEFTEDERAVFAENNIRMKGWYDSANNAKFAYGKLYEAEECILHVSEIELWCISQVYNFDKFEVLYGEATSHFNKPPDYVTLQSNILFNAKNDAKIINKNYVEGKHYTDEIPDTIPKGIAINLKNGLCSKQFFESYYTSTVKGMFNGIYGTMAQDILKPEYAVDEGELYVDEQTKVSEDNYNEKLPRRNKVLYTYGLRIVGGSRMHLIIAILLLYGYFNDSIIITGGDTDSLKISLLEDIKNEQLIEALIPLHKAVTNAINITMLRVRKLFPNFASTLDDIGCFECENENNDRYIYHMEAWNKARISIDNNYKTHITCAGLSRPDKEYTIETFIDELLLNNKPEDILPNILGYNVFVNHNLSFSLEHFRPLAIENYIGEITDYKGDTYKVNQKQAVAIYDSGRLLGDLSKRTNFSSYEFAKEMGTEIDGYDKFLEIDENGNPVIRNANGSVLYE